MRKRVANNLPVLTRKNLRIVGAIFMIKLNAFLCYGTLTGHSQYIDSWITVQMLAQAMDFILWIVELSQRQIEFNCCAGQKFLVMACNLHIIRTFGICVRFASTQGFFK